MALLAYSIKTSAQTLSRYNTFSYNVNEGLLQSTIGSIEVDKDNFCWISFPNGIQKFDGRNFVQVPVQEGLPDDKLAAFFRCSNGDLLISHSQGISLYEIEKNSFRQVYRSTSGNVLFIGEDDGVIYFFSHDGIITGISKGGFQQVSAVRSGLQAPLDNKGYLPKVSDNIIQHRVVLLFNDTLCLWDVKAGKLLYKTSRFAGISSFVLHLKDATRVLYRPTGVAGTLNIYDFVTGAVTPVTISKADPAFFIRCKIFPWRDKLLLTLDDRLYETDSSLSILHSELVNFQNKPVTTGNSIASIREDNFGNLYIQTVTGGIRKIIRNNYPVKYYSTHEAGRNFILCILPDKKRNRVLAGAAGNGVLIFDTLQRLVKQVGLTDKLQKNISPNCILKTPKGDYLVFASGQRTCWLLSSDLSRLSAIPFLTALPPDESGSSYFTNTLLTNEREALVQTQDRIYRVDMQYNRIREHLVANGYIMSGLFHSQQVILHVNDELLFLDTTRWQIQKHIPFPNTGYVRCYAAGPGNTIYIGSNKGIFNIDNDGKVLHQMNKSTGLPDECIYAMAFDEKNNLWCSSNKGIFRTEKNKVTLQLTREDGLQENEFNTNCVAVAGDGELYFGGVNGFSSFYPQQIVTHQENLSLIFTRIRANNEDIGKNTAVRSLEKIVLPYSQNALSFDFVAMGNSNPDQYLYQYRMDGVDEEWIQGNPLQTARYVLPPGEYTFNVSASRSFDAKAEPLKKIVIIIRAPFWKTGWFRIGAALLLISLLAYLINQRNKKKYATRLQQLEQEKQLKQERERISKDLHDSLGAYANAVLYNTELLEKGEGNSKELISGLKYVSKDIITTLRETVWALRKERFSGEECLVRIRNFVEPLKRYYPHIEFTVTGESPPTILLHHTRALNMVRLVQEAITNSIKHAAPRFVSVTAVVISNRWMITVSDDGVGFDHKAIRAEERGNGLSNMEYRAAEAGFELTITSVLNKGTSISVLI